MRGRIGRMATLALATCLGATVGAVGAEDAAPKEGKKASISDSPYEKGPPATTGGFTDTWQGGKKTSGAIPDGLMGGTGGAKPEASEKE